MLNENIKIYILALADKKKIKSNIVSFLELLTDFFSCYFTNKPVFYICDNFNLLLRFLESESHLVRFLEYSKNIDNKLFVLWRLRRFDDYFDVYSKKHLKINDINRARYLYKERDYKGLSECLKSFHGTRSELCELCEYYIYMSLINNKYSVFDAIEKSRSIIGDNRFYDIYENYFRGDVVKAEEARSSTRGSNKSQIDFVFKGRGEVPSIEEIKKLDEVLFIPEQGIADEVRWSRLYQYLDHKNITFACDVRIKDLIENSLKNAKVLDINSLYNSRNNVSDLVASISLNKYSRILSTVSIFSILEEEKISTVMSPYLAPFKVQRMVKKKGDKKKVGIVWRSSVINSHRQFRYGVNIKSLLGVIKDFMDEIDFYCIQDTLMQSEIDQCIEAGVKVNLDIDFYNDFNAVAQYVKDFDAVVGISTLITELSSAVGPVFYHIANSPNIKYMRESVEEIYVDQLSNNSITVSPDVGFYESMEAINKSCYEKALRMILKDQSPGV